MEERKCLRAWNSYVQGEEENLFGGYSSTPKLGATLADSARRLRTQTFKV